MTPVAGFVIFVIVVFIRELCSLNITLDLLKAFVIVAFGLTFICIQPKLIRYGFKQFSKVNKNEE